MIKGRPALTQIDHEKVGDFVLITVRDPLCAYDVDPAKKIAEEGLKLYFLAVPFVGFNIVSAMFFTSTERALPAQMISVLRGLVVIIPAAFILSAVFEMQGVWLSYPVTEGIVTIFAVCVLLKSAGRKPGTEKA